MNHIIEAVKQGFGGHVDFHQRREGVLQLIIPILHEDGDMIDVFVTTSPKGGGLIRIKDIGLTLMRLSYTYEINTPPREKLLQTILAQNGVQEDDGELYMDSTTTMIFQNIMQFVGLVQKVCNLRLWQREHSKTMFYHDLETFIFSSLALFKPKKNVTPLANYPVLDVDYMFLTKSRPFYLYGVNSPDKAKTAAISLLEFQKANLPFMGIIVYENMEAMPKKAATYLTRNADKQFTTLGDFCTSASQTLGRLAA